MSDRKFRSEAPNRCDLAAFAVLTLAMICVYLLSIVERRVQEVALDTQYVSDDQTSL